MLICNNAVYVDAAKTGSSYVEFVLKKVTARVDGERHSMEDSIKPNRLYYTTVRNPFSHYVSRYTFDRRGIGKIYDSFVKSGFKDEGINSFYDYFHSGKSVLPAINFNKQCWDNWPKELGQQTYRYLYMLDHQFLLDKKRSVSEIEEWYNQYWFENNKFVMLNTDNLKDELYAYIEKNEMHFNVRPDWKQIFVNIQNDSKSSSKIQKIHNKNMIDSYLEEKIYSWERILIKQFNYTSDFRDKWK